MKNIVIFIFSFLMIAGNVLGQSAAKFEKLYGDQFENRASVIKAFGDGIYVGSTQERINEEWGVFSKFDPATGALLWDVTFFRPLKINDFEYVENDDAFILVGHTTPNQTSSGQVDNYSVIMKIDDSGTILSSKIYARNGREGFTRIVKHSNPVDADFPYYVLGTQNPTPTTNADDQVTLFNFDGNLSYKWGNEYQYRVGINGDDEFHRGLVEMQNGDLIMLGNDILANDGITVIANGLNGGVEDASRTNTGKIDYYDAIILDNGSAFVVGEYFEEGEALISNGNGEGFRVKDVEKFTDIWEGENGKLYVIGKHKSASGAASESYPIVFTFTYTNDILSFESAFYIENGETDFDQGYIYASPDHEEIFYVDTRKTDAFSNAGFDLLVGSIDPNMLSLCATSHQPVLEPFNYEFDGIIVNGVRIPEPSFLSNDLSSSQLSYTCEDFCNTQNCSLIRGQFLSIRCTRQVSLSVIPNGFVGTPIFSWDFGDGTTLQGGTTESHTYAANGTYDICVTADDGDCSATYCIDATVSASGPGLNPPVNTTFDVTDIDNCTNDTDLSISSRDPCTGFPLTPICSRSDGSTNLTDPWSVGTTSVTCTATGSNGLSTTINFDVVVNDPTGVCCKIPDFYKLYGDGETGTIIKIEEYQGAIYALGYRGATDSDFQAFLMKLDLAGTIEWTAQLPKPYIMNDFIPTKSGFLLVGENRPIDVNTNSAIVKINLDGTLGWARSYDFAGRERFIRIASAPAAGNPSIASNTEFLVLGFVTPFGFTDDQSLIKIDENGTEIWRKELDHNNGDDQAHSAFRRLNNGSYMLSGQANVGQLGVLNADATSGVFGTEFAATPYRFSDIVEANSKVYVVGSNSTSGYILVLENSGTKRVAKYTLPDIERVSRVQADSEGNLYLLVKADIGDGNNNRNLIYKLKETLPRVNQSNLEIEWIKYIDNGSLEFRGAAIHVANDRLIFSEGLLDHPSGFGDFDDAIGIFDLNMSGECVISIEGHRIEGISNNDEITGAYTITDLDFPRSSVFDLDDPLNYKMADLDCGECMDCQNFTPGTVEGWYSNTDGCGGNDGVTITIGNNGPLGAGDNVLYGEDECGTSFLINSTDFSKDWSENEGDCFCWDYKIYSDADGSSVIPVYSNLSIWSTPGGGADPRPGNVNRAIFVTNIATNENSDWVRICAPIESCSGSIPPSNAYGSWQIVGGGTCTDWNALFTNVTHMTLGIDYFNSPAEEMAWDNFCFEPCGTIGTPVNCDSLNLIGEYNPNTSSDSLCCWNFDIENYEFGSNIQTLEIKILTSGTTPEWIFDSFNANTGFEVNNEYRYKDIHKGIEFTGGYIPQGLSSDAFDFCFRNPTGSTINSPVPVEIKWVQDLGGELGLAVCTDTMYFDCPSSNDSCEISFIWETDCYDLIVTPNYFGFTGIPTLTWTLDGVPFDPNHTFPTTGSYEVCVTATDRTCSAVFCETVTVSDTDNPVITCNQLDPVQTETGTCFAQVVPDVTATDNCGPVTILCSTTDGQDCSFNFPKGTTTLIYTARDAAGNTVSCDVTIEVIDREFPVVTCQPLSAVLDQFCEVTVQPEDFIVSMSDNCEIVGTSINRSVFGADDACRTVPVVISVEDCGGNISECATSIIIDDVTPPRLLSCPSDIILPLGADFSDITLTGFAEGVDNCSAVTVDYLDVTIEECPKENIIERTWILTDACGNVNDECMQVIRQGCDSDCQDFTPGNVEGWYSNDDGCGGSDGVTISISNNGPTGAGDNALYGEDECGSSILINSTDFSMDWTENEGDCFCWDYKIYEDANSSTVIPVYSNLSIWYSTGGADPRDNNLHRAIFITNVATTENSDWVRICAPIETCPTGSSLPSNAYGNWLMVGGGTCTDWNDLLANVSHVTLGIDYFNNPAEEMAWDNFCFEPCGQIGESAECDSLNLIPNYDEVNSNDDLCCWNLDIENYSNLTNLQTAEIRILTSGTTPEWTFGSFSGNGGFQVKNDYRFPDIHKGIESTSGYISNGTFLDAISFCFESPSGMINSPVPVEIKWVQDLGGDLGLATCIDTMYFDCPTNSDPCEVSFTWETDCYDLLTTPTYFGFNGVPDLSWTLDGVPFDPNHTFSATGSYLVCVVATDSLCMDEFCATVTVEDNEAPAILCPQSGSVITVGTDPGECFGTLELTAFDNCDDLILISYTLSGATIGSFTNVSGAQLNLGLTNVFATATDFAGNTSVPCNFNVLVEDQEDPVIVCPQVPTVTIPGCQRGVNVDFADPSISDNCPDVTFTCDYQSGAFFFCGITTVSCTATDAAGNTASCNFNINVDCQCAQILTSTIECGDEPDTYDFIVEIENLTGSNTACDFAVSMPASQGQLGVTNIDWNPGFTIGTVTGEITPVIPISSTFDLIFDATCICPGRDSFRCSLPVSLTPVCCKEAYLEGKEICSEVAEFPVEVTFGGVVNSVIQVDWYLSYEPCSAPVWQHYATSFDVTTDVFPPYLDLPAGDNDFCMYAVATVGDFPCSTITSDTAEFILCDPIGCSIPSQEFCYTGTPITPAPLILSIDNSDCQYEIEWLDANGNIISGQTGQTSYQPPTLNWTAPQDDCKQEFSFSARIESVCGIEVCTSVITFHNDDAPVGIITMDPFEPQPFCPGEDATLTFEPECPMPPPSPQWTWFSGPMQNVLTPIAGAGDTNPLIHTNRVWTDTWFGVETQNGTCAPDMSTFFIDVYDRLAINSFQLSALDPCRETGLTLSVDYDPTDCPVEIDWYKDGVIINTATYSSSPATWTYENQPSGYGGNYYAIVKSTCCPEEVVKSQVEVFDPPIELVLTAPCFRCNSEDYEIVANVLNGDANCTFKWYRQIGTGAPTLLPETSNVLMTNSDDVFSVEIDCDGCQKTATFQVNQCGLSPISTAEPTLDLSMGLYPNPTDETVFLTGKEPFKTGFRLEVLNLTGQKMKEIEIPVGQTTVEFSIGEFASGVYMVRVSEFGRVAWAGKIVKQ